MKQKIADLLFFIKHRIAVLFAVCLLCYCTIVAGSRVYINASGIGDEVMEQVRDTIAAMDIQETDEDGESYISVPKLAMQNIRAGMIGLFSGIVPFLCIPAIILAENAVMLGAVLIPSDYLGVSALQILLYGILPHGVLEVPAMIICYACGVRICISMTAWILKRRDWFRTRYDITNAIVTAVVIGIPLFIGAAFVESYITPDLLYRMVLAPALGLA